ncbi:MAG: hypothetical protein EPN14_09315 [Gallionella sp.]|nr:MAG: hypothetical protein EPN14_09315 [Gallionella sp.]
MAVKVLGLINRVINKTTTEILDGQVVNKITGVVGTFLNSGVEAIRDMTSEEPEEAESARETPG